MTLSQTLTLSLAVTLGFAGSLSLAAPADPIDVIGSIGQERITETDIVAAHQADFDGLKVDFEVRRRQLELEYAEARHDLLQKQLDERLDQAALSQEARSRGIAPDQVLQELKPVVPTDEEVRALYEANKDRIKQPYEAVAQQALKFLTKQRNQAATRAFYDDLRAKHGITSSFPPYRLDVAASGPVRGSSSAPVTIVEFADFQCPYCKEAESSLHAVLDKYPQDIRLVFRNLPLTKIHPNAKVAAEAAVCAERQGKFWEMHDAMYQDQRALDLDSLKGTAKRLGLDPGRFSACLNDGSTQGSLDSDAKAAHELGLDGTPYFFVNGRPIDGNVPFEKLESVVADELRRASAAKG